MTELASASTKRRVPLWDNARWLAIGLVVIGHGILPMISESNQAYSVYLAIYSFHVAVFVMISGYFSKSGAPNARALKRVITELVLPYLIFETLWTLIRWAMNGSATLDYTTPSWTLWFLLALALWRICLPYLVMLRWPLLIAVIISVGAGYSAELTSTFALSRTFGMLPFFVFGWQLRQWNVTGRWLNLSTAAVWRWRAGAVAIFVTVLLVAYSSIDVWRELKLRRFLLYDEGYEALGFDDWWMGAMRFALIVIALALSVAFLMLMPRRNTWFTAWGAATMYIYLLHSFALYPMRESGIVSGDQPAWVFALVLLYCVVITIVLSQSFIRRIFRPLVEPRAAWLFRQVPDTKTGTIVLPDEK